MTTTEPPLLHPFPHGTPTDAVRIGSLFSGAAGLDRAAAEVFGAEVVWLSEVDPAASRVLAHHFPDVPNLGDITQVDWADVPPVDVLCGGFPCFPAGTLIDAGEDGLRPIETLRVGDMVLTHQRRRRAVTSVMRRHADDVLVIDAMGAPRFRATAEHPFYVRRRNEGRKRTWTEPQWIAAGELRPGDMLAMPIDDPTDTPVIGEELAYIVGRWLGDGWIVDHKRTSTVEPGRRGSRITSRVHKAIICAAHEEAGDLAEAIKRAGLHATPATERTVTKFHISSQELVKLLRDFGRGAAGKRLPGWVFTAPQGERRALLKGWLDADGLRNTKPPQWRGATVSEELAHGMARLGRNVHGVATSLHMCPRPKSAVIEGRQVNQLDGYEVVIPDRNREAFVEGGFAWVPVRSVREGEPCEVFNVSVDEDESYTAWGYTVHNCQDVSAAGKRAGIKDGTRSGLWSVFAEAIDALRPRFVVIENVRGLLSAAAHRTVECGDSDVESVATVVGDGSGGPVLRALGAVLGDLADLGYDAQWTTLAASSVGAPHRRERVFILASATDAGTGRRGTGIENVLPGHQPDAHRGGIGGTAEVELLPTPAACNPNDGEGVETWLARREVVKARVGNGNGMGMPLTIAVQLLPGDGAVDLLPTPRSLDSTGVRGRTPNRSDEANARAGRTLTDEVMLLPTPSAADGGGGHLNRSGERGGELLLPGIARAHATGDLLPTPTTQDGANCAGPSQFDRNTLPLNAAVTLLPTPGVADCTGGGADPERREAGGHHVQLIDEVLSSESRWGKYAPAIARWEAVLGRPAPAPTEPNRNGRPRLNPEFASWMMGWPAGWVTDPAIGIGRNDQLRIVGNGVVTLQAVAALRYLLSVCEMAA